MKIDWEGDSVFLLCNRLSTHARGTYSPYSVYQSALRCFVVVIFCLYDVSCRANSANPI